MNTATTVPVTNRSFFFLWILDFWPSLHAHTDVRVTSIDDPQFSPARVTNDALEISISRHEDVLVWHARNFEPAVVAGCPTSNGKMNRYFHCYYYRCRPPKRDSTSVIVNHEHPSKSPSHPFTAAITVCVRNIPQRHWKHRLAPVVVSAFDPVLRLCV